MLQFIIVSVIVIMCIIIHVTFLSHKQSTKGEKSGNEGMVEELGPDDSFSKLTHDNNNNGMKAGNEGMVEELGPDDSFSKLMVL